MSLCGIPVCIYFEKNQVLEVYMISVFFFGGKAYMKGQQTTFPFGICGCFGRHGMNDVN